ncbi:MAG: RHS repeat-associated core domain-containing protein [Opitutaceae bacterium]
MRFLRFPLGAVARLARERSTRHHFCAFSLALALVGSTNTLAAPLNVTTDLDLPEDSAASYDSISVSNGAVLTIGGGSDITVTGAVTVTGNASIVFAGKNVDAQVGGEWLGEGSSLTAASVTVASGSTIHADGQGYLSGLGPGGPGVGANTTGASHGGRATGTASLLKPVYGSMRQPLDLGSAAGVYASTTAGGGAIRLVVSGTLTVNGTLSADGIGTGTNHSGAAGGSVWITTANLAGSGSIRANAAVRGFPGNNDSGGGRVAVYFEDASGFTDLSAIEAKGQGGAQDGTVYLRDTSTSNGSLIVHGRVRFEPDSDVTHTAVTVEDGGILELGGGTSLNVTGVLRVKGGGVVLAEGKNTGAQVNEAWAGAGVSITAATLTVDLNGRLHADGQGYLSGLGPGGPGAGQNTVGASHGGRATGSASLLKTVYGSMREPVDLGSASGVFASATAGGGAIRLVVSGTLTVNGTLSADGTATGTNHSGAAGGSLWITTANLVGSGSIRANAAVKGFSANNDSGGGRVAVYYANASGFGDLSAIQANGQGDAQDGTVYLRDTTTSNGSLIVHGRVRIQPDEAPTYTGITVEGGGLLELGGGSSLTVTGTLRVKGGGVVLAEGKNRDAQVNEAWAGAGVSITAATLTVDLDGRVHADGQGYSSGLGPGGPGAGANNSGASHGGLATSSTSVVKSAYGSMVEPVDLGSASGVFASVTAGGGAIRLTVSGTLTVNGTLSADGTATGTNHSGAAGGSIWITTVNLAGSGTIQANAVAKGFSGNKDSSGGRVALYYGDASGFTDLSAIQAKGQGSAQDGTVYLRDTTTGNGSLIVHGRVRIDPDTSVTQTAITVEDGGVLELGGGSSLTVTGTLRVKGGGVVLAEGKNRDAQVNEAWAGAGVSITATTLTVDLDGHVDADGQGYPSGLGPGGPGKGANTVGASHGGRATGSASVVKSAYGSMTEPVDLGSASGVFGSVTAGGGAIRLTVSGTLTVNGTLSADATSTGTNHSGAAGGSIWITTNTLAGSGTIRANAAPGGSSGNNDSSGGRVAVYYADASGFANLGNIQANGQGSAEAGTVYLARDGVGGRHLTVLKRLVVEPGPAFSVQSMEVNNGRVEMRPGAVLSIADTLALAGTARIFVEWDGVGGRIEAGNLTVAENASILADGLGYGPGESPDGPTAGQNTVGAGHGGDGGGSGNNREYGDPLEPSTAGAAGGVFASTTRGGGVIRIVVDGNLDLDGTISANGTASGSNHSGAAGGSIWVDADTLSGTGFFRANAATKGMGSNSDSSGGRIAVYYDTADDFEGFVATSADAGGPGAEDGSVVFIDRSVPNLALRVLDRLAFPERSSEAFGRVTVELDGQLELGGGSILAVASELELAGNAVLEAQSVDAVDLGGGVYTGRGVTILAKDLTIGAGATITADGFGYPSSKGPGGSTSNSVGGSHGGKGGGASAPVYGNAEQPVDLGSSGGVFGSQLRAGGAVRLVVPGQLTHDGAITANGIVVSGANHSGTTGGSIWIQAGSVSGDGVVQANASAKGTASNNRGSAGGRIAIGTTGAMELDLNRIEARPTDDSAEAGTVRIQDLETIEAVSWVSDLPPIIFGAVDVSWVVLSSDLSVTSTLRLLDGESETVLLNSSSIVPSFAWDTTSVPDGDYSLMVTVVNGDGDLVGELQADVFVANEYVWHSGTIEADESWPADRLNVVRGNLVIADGVSVTIEPGTVIKVTPKSRIDLRPGASINGEGTEALPIVFTSFLDDARVGDSNRDGNRTVPGAGDWRGIALAVGSQLNTNELVSFFYAVDLPDKTINGTVRWRTGTLQWVTADVTVATGATLIIEPGAIIKFGQYKGLILSPGSTLVAEGTLAQPIIFTSERDDAHGGDTNEDGNTTAPAAGDWRWIYVNGSPATFDHVKILYGGGTGTSWSGTGVIRTTGSSEVLIDNSLVSDSFFDGVLAWGGPVTIRNSVFRNIDRAVSAHPGSAVTIRNSTFDRNRIGLLIHGGTLDVANSIISNSFTAGLLRDFGGDTKTMSHNLFFNPRAAQGNTASVADVIGTDGNIAADPGFLNGAGGEYRLQADSPAIDAADTTVAPDSDRNGAPRFNEPTVADTGVAGAGGVIADIGAYEYAEGAASEVDLVVTAVTAPAEATVGGSAVLTWTVRNDGSVTVAGPWVDEVWLVANPDTGSEILRESRTVLVGSNLRLEPGESVTFTEEIAVPGSTVGLHRWKVRTNAPGSLFEGANRANNDRTSAGTTRIDVPAVAIGGEPQSVFLRETGDQFVFVIDTRKEGAILQAITAGNGLALPELYWAFDRLPSPTDFDGRNQEFGQDDVSLFAPRGGLAYILVNVSGLTQPDVALSLSAEAVDFRISGVSPRSIGDSGTATLEVAGALLDDQLAFSLVSVATGQAYPGTATYSTVTNLAYPTFPLDGVPHGTYRVRAARDGASVDSVQTVSVGATRPAELDVRLIGDTQVRAGRKGGATVLYRNTGNVDLVAPLMQLNAAVRVEPPVRFASAGLRSRSAPDGPPVAADEPLFIDNFLGISSDGPAGILRPDSKTETHVLSFEAPVDRNSLTIDLLWQTANFAGSPFRWDDFKDALRLPDLPDEGWNNVFELLRSEAGETFGEVNATAARNATQLSRVGERERRFAFLLMQSIRAVDPNGWTIEQGRPTRIGDFLPDITRNRAYRVERDHVAVWIWGKRATYQPTLDDSVWVPMVENRSRLRFKGDHFELTTVTGAAYVFKPDGDLAFFSDPATGRLDFAYNSGRLVAVRDGDRNLVMIGYDGNGMVNSITGPDGLDTTLTHDAAGNLTRVVAPTGLTADLDYFETGYRSGRVRSLKGNNGEVHDFLYDDIGRLVDADSNGAAVSFAYPGVGLEVISSDSGDVMEKRFGTLAQLVEVLLNGKQIFRSDLKDGAGSERFIVSGGLSRTTFFNEDDTVTRFVDPLGSVTNVTLNDALELTQITDPLGRSTTYEYDDSGNRIARVDALGERSEADYDDDGRVTRVEDRAGKVITFVYDENDRLVERSYGGGLKDEFTYNEKGWLVSARNAAGTTSLDYTTNGLVKEVSFPNGHSVSYTYDETGRITQVEDDSGYVVRYAFDDRGDLRALLDEDGNVLTEYSINSLGQLQTESRANGTESSYTFDAGQRVAGVTHLKPDASPLAGVTYTFDALGRRTGADFGNAAYAFEYDDFSRLTGFERDDTAYEFAYDAVGSRQSTTGPGGGQTYAVDALNRYVSAGERQYEYDANGYLTKQTIGSEVWTYVYDDLNQLTRVTGPGVDVRYDYDALGYRIRETRGSEVSDYLPNPLMRDTLLAVHEGAISTHFGYGRFGYSWFEREGEGAYFLHYDGSGNVLRVTDIDGDTVNSYEYLPFGELVSETETVPNRLTFAGRHGVLEAPGDQYWIQLRTYDPWLGRFLSPDPAVTEGDNPYTYAANQPTNFTDYEGYEEQSQVFDSSGTANLTNANLASSAGQNITESYLRTSNNWAIQEREVARNQYLRDNATFKKRVASGHRNDIRKSSNRLKNSRSRLNHANKNVKATSEALESGKNFTTKNNFGKFLKGLQVAGTVVTTGNAVETQMRYNNGETTLAETVRGWALLANDGLGYVPGLGTAGSFMNSSLDAATRENWVLLANWWYTPDDPFGPGMTPRGGRRSLNSRVVSSYDPNDKASTGVGEGGYIDGQGPIEYRIRFENLPTASAAAQQVRISDFLDVKLDWSTLELLEFGLNDAVIVPPEGATGYSGVARVSADPNPVQCEIHLDPATGELTVDLRSFDEETGDWPTDPFAGFLPPNDETGRGEGYLRFSIWPMPGLEDGTVIENQASIVFDENEPIITNVAVNTIDTMAPTALVAALGERSAPRFSVSWSGDDAGGSGVERFDVYVSVDGGEWTLWQEGTTETSADYEGTPGSSYAFYVHATDALGFANPVAPTAQAQTIAGVSFLVNIANRGGVGTGPNIMIPGFVINGTGTKKVLVRAVGPELETYSVTGFLEDPELRVVSGGTVVAANDDWSDAANAVEIATVANQVGAFPLKDGSKDAAALLDLVPGSYTVKASGVGQTTGVALVEVYDVDDSANPGAKLVNISNRGEVGVGAAIMIPGFVIGGESAKTVLIRGVGPKLADYNVTGVLEDPTLRLFRAGEATPLLTNDNWSDAANAAELAAAAETVGAFALDAGSKDAAVLVTLEPGSYTVKVSGAGGTEGVALVEVYEVGD